MKCLSSSLCCSWHSVLLCCVGELRTRGVCGGCGNQWRAGEGATRAVLASLRYDTWGSLQGIFISELFCMKLAPVPTFLRIDTCHYVISPPPFLFCFISRYLADVPPRLGSGCSQGCCTHTRTAPSLPAGVSSMQ